MLRDPGGPPGHEHLHPLAPPDPDDDVAAREGTPVHSHVLHASRAFAEALFTTSAGPPEASRIDWLVEDFGRFLAAATPRARLVMRLCLFASTWLAPLFVLRPVPLSWLPLPKRIEALERLEASFLGPAALAPKAMLCMLWLEHPEVQRETRTTPTCKGATS